MTSAVVLPVNAPPVAGEVRQEQEIPLSHTLRQELMPGSGGGAQFATSAPHTTRDYGAHGF